MKETYWEKRIRSALTFAVKAILILAVLITTVGFVEVNNALHPPRIIPPGNTLRKFNIPYQSLDLITADGVRLSAWYTPPRKGAVILLAHGYGDNRPEWIHALLAKKGYGVMSWDARAHGESDGKISTIGYLEVLDVRAALDYVLAQPSVCLCTSTPRSSPPSEVFTLWLSSTAALSPLMAFGFLSHLLHQYLIDPLPDTVSLPTPVDDPFGTLERIPQ